MSVSSRLNFASVPEYLASLDPAHSKVLKSVLSVVRKSVPKSELVISYGIPAFRSGQVFIYCAAFPMALIARVAKVLAKQYARPAAPSTKRKAVKKAGRNT